MKRFLLYAGFFCLVTNVWAADSTIAKKVYHVKHINPHAPVIDGRLDDPAWEKAEWATHFT
jgi:hypothetical protein